MQHRIETTRTADGLTLHVQSWWPEERSQALVAVMHGYGEHSGRHARTAEALAQQGYAVVAWDHRGHGRSEGRRAYVERFDHYLDDALAVIRSAQAGYEGPLYLLGHSMGGTLAVLLTLGGRLHPAGLILSAAALAPGEDIPPIMVRLAPLLGAVLPSLPTVKIKSHSLSRDEQIVEQYDTDPLNFRGAAPARFASEFLGGILRARAGVPRLELPLLVLYGGQDQLINPEGSRFVYAEAHSTDKTIQCYGPCYHEILNEPEREQVLDDIMAWLEAHTG